ncbi:MAG: hypothetical protein HGA44_00475, partial [Cellulomonadaceae bacterium]|nr:hypothetical protein [Cellulomonadaceae bacterium]
MPIDDRRAAWLTGLRTSDDAVHRRLSDEAAHREVEALEGRLLTLQAELVALRRAVGVRDHLLHDQRVAIAERDARIDHLAALDQRSHQHPTGRATAARAGRAAARVARALVR